MLKEEALNRLIKAIQILEQGAPTLARIILEDQVLPYFMQEEKNDN